MYTSNIKLDLAGNGVQARIPVRKGDKETVTAWISIYNNGEPVDVSGYAAAVYYARGGERYSTVCDVADGRVRYDISEGLMNTAGRVECELRFTRTAEGSGRVLSSPRFAVVVEDTVYTGVTSGEAASDEVLADMVAKLAAIENGAEVNIIETVKVNGTAIIPDADRAVDITVPTAAVDIGAAEAEHGHEMSDVVGLTDVLTSKAADADLDAHTGDTGNPHGVTAAQAGAVPVTRRVNGLALSADISLGAGNVGAAEAVHGHAMNDVTGLVNALAAKAADADLDAHTGDTGNPHRVTAAQAGAVPRTRKVNNKVLSSDITLNATDVGAAEAEHTHEMSDITDGHSHVNKAALDKLADDNGALTYNGEAVGGEAVIFNYNPENEFSIEDAEFIDVSLFFERVPMFPIEGTDEEIIAQLVDGEYYWSTGGVGLYDSQGGTLPLQDSVTLVTQPFLAECEYQGGGLFATYFDGTYIQAIDSDSYFRVNNSGEYSYYFVKVTPPEAGQQYCACEIIRRNANAEDFATKLESCLDSTRTKQIKPFYANGGSGGLMPLVDFSYTDHENCWGKFEVYGEMFNEGTVVAVANGEMPVPLIEATSPEGFASVAQGEKADTAIQTVKLNGTAITPDENRAVDIVVGGGSGSGHIVVDTFDDLPAEAEYGARATVRESQLLVPDVYYDALAFNSEPGGIISSHFLVALIRLKHPVFDSTVGYIHLLVYPELVPSTDGNPSFVLLLMYSDVSHVDGEEVLTLTKTLAFVSHAADPNIAAGWNRVYDASGDEFESWAAVINGISAGEFTAEQTTAPTSIENARIESFGGMGLDVTILSQIINIQGSSGRDKGEYLYNGTRWVRLNGGLDVRTDYRSGGAFYIAVDLISNCSYSIITPDTAVDGVKFFVSSPDEPDIPNEINITLRQISPEGNSYIVWSGDHLLFSVDNPEIENARGGNSWGSGYYTATAKWNNAYKQWHIFVRKYLDEV